jgi:D-alanine-D-alanine ligase-like ATP-grasp enzyme
MVLEHYGIPTSPFAIINLDRHPEKPITPKVINSLTKGSRHASSLLDPASYPLFAKPLAEDTSKGIKQISIIHNVNQLCQAVEELRSSTRAIPAILVEKFLAGREFTVGILGTGDDAWVLGVDEIVWNDPITGDSDADVDVTQFATEKSRTSEDWDGIADEIPANRADPQVERACIVALRAWRAIGCRDGGRIDIRFDASAGVANVLEVSDVLWRVSCHRAEASAMTIAWLRQRLCLCCVASLFAYLLGLLGGQA